MEPKITKLDKFRKCSVIFHSPSDLVPDKIISMRLGRWTRAKGLRLVAVALGAAVSACSSASDQLALAAEGPWPATYPAISTDTVGDCPNLAGWYSAVGDVLGYKIGPGQERTYAYRRQELATIPQWHPLGVNKGERTERLALAQVPDLKQGEFLIRQDSASMFVVVWLASNSEAVSLRFKRDAQDFRCEMAGVTLGPVVFSGSSEGVTRTSRKSIRIYRGVDGSLIYRELSYSRGRTLIISEDRNWEIFYKHPAVTH